MTNTWYVIELEERIEKLEDWKNDIEKGWIDMGQYCKKCQHKITPEEHLEIKKKHQEAQELRKKLKKEGLLPNK